MTLPFSTKNLEIRHKDNFYYKLLQDQRVRVSGIFNPKITVSKKTKQIYDPGERIVGISALLKNSVSTRERDFYDLTSAMIETGVTPSQKLNDIAWFFVDFWIDEIKNAQLKWPSDTSMMANMLLAKDERYSSSVKQILAQFYNKDNLSAIIKHVLDKVYVVEGTSDTDFRYLPTEKLLFNCGTYVANLHILEQFGFGFSNIYNRILEKGISLSGKVVLRSPNKIGLDLEQLNVENIFISEAMPGNYVYLIKSDDLSIVKLALFDKFKYKDISFDDTLFPTETQQFF